MAALAKDRNTRSKAGGRTISLKIAASTTIYKGAVVATNATGFAVPASDTAALDVVGIADEQIDNSAGADGDVSVRVSKGTFALVAAASVTQADVGQTVMADDDQTVQDATAATSDIPVGVLDSIDPNTGEAWVFIQ